MTAPPSRVMALDYGTVRIGVALSDERRILATPLCVVQNNARALDEIAQLAARNDVALIVVGLPLKEDGGESAMTARARQFAAEVRQRTGLPAELYDERYTSLLARDSMIASGKRRKARRQKGEADKRAAAILLQEYLDGLAK